MRSGKALTLTLFLLTLAIPSCGDDESDGDDGSTAACAVSSDACIEGCIRPECGAEIDACSDDATCDAAKDEMVSCICDAQRADDSDGVGVCIQNFTDTGGILSTPFIYCAATRCQSPCDL
jgi:hypothetical protein